MPQSPVLHRWIRVLSAAALALTLTVGSLSEVQAQEKKPNILVIMGDDIGIWNISVWNRGMMGFQTPNIDRIANGGDLGHAVGQRRRYAAGILSGRCALQRRHLLVES